MIFPNTFRRFRFLNATGEQIDAVDVYYATVRDPGTNAWLWIPAMNPIQSVLPFRARVEQTLVPDLTPVKAVRVAVTKTSPPVLQAEPCEQVCVYEAVVGSYVGEALFLFENDPTGQAPYRVTLEVASLHTMNPDDWHYTGHEHLMPSPQGVLGTASVAATAARAKRDEPAKAPAPAEAKGPAKSTSLRH